MSANETTLHPINNPKKQTINIGQDTTFNTDTVDSFYAR